VAYDAWIAKRLGIKDDELTRESLGRYQLAKINEIIALTREHSPFYKRHLQGCGSSPLADLADVARLPFLTPHDLRNSGLKMLCVSQGEISRVVTLETSGTTGPPKQLYFTGQDQELTVDFFVQSMSRLIQADERVSILLPADRPGGVGDLLYRAVSRLRALPVKHGLVTKLPVMLENLFTRPVRCLVGVPVQILALAKYYEASGEKRKLRLKNILLCTDYVSPSIVKEIERIWDCRVFDYYGMTEAGLGGGMECSARSGYHLHEADLYFEIVDPVSGGPVLEGREGEVVISTLTRRGMPLLRYRTGDLSRFVPEPCPCGAILRRLEKIRKRKNGPAPPAPYASLAMADLDDVLFPLFGLVDFSVNMVCGKKKNTLELTLYSLHSGIKEQDIRTALSSAPSLLPALASGALDVAMANKIVGDTIFPASAKRQIRVFSS
jgi:phenylacetate-coenzyme A ligase PaaK-like adenylate-forming protein